MRFVRLPLALVFVLALAADSFAERPQWPWITEPCEHPSGICFLEFDFGTAFQLDDEEGMLLAWVPQSPNSFLRHNPDGSWFIHMISQDADVGYLTWDGAIEWWCEPPLSGKEHMTGTVFQTETGGLDIGCPFSGHIKGIIVDPDTGRHFRATASWIEVPDPDSESGCRTVQRDVDLRPIK